MLPLRLAMIADGKTMQEVINAKPTSDFDTVYGPETASLGFCKSGLYELIKAIKPDWRDTGRWAIEQITRLRAFFCCCRFLEKRDPNIRPLKYRT